MEQFCLKIYLKSQTPLSSLASVMWTQLQTVHRPLSTRKSSSYKRELFVTQSDRKNCRRSWSQIIPFFGNNFSSKKAPIFRIFLNHFPNTLHPRGTFSWKWIFSSTYVRSYYRYYKSFQNRNCYFIDLNYESFPPQWRSLGNACLYQNTHRFSITWFWRIRITMSQKNHLETITNSRNFVYATSNSKSENN